LDAVASAIDSNLGNRRRPNPRTFRHNLLIVNQYIHLKFLRVLRSSKSLKTKKPGQF